MYSAYAYLHRSLGSSWNCGIRRDLSWRELGRVLNLDNERVEATETGRTERLDGGRREALEAGRGGPALDGVNARLVR